MAAIHGFQLQRTFRFTLKNVTIAIFETRWRKATVSPADIAVCKLASPYILLNCSTLRIKPFLPYVSKTAMFTQTRIMEHIISFSGARQHATVQDTSCLNKTTRGTRILYAIQRLLYLFEVQALFQIQSKTLALLTRSTQTTSTVLTTIEWSCLNSPYLGRWRAGARQRSCIRQLDDSSLRKHRCFGTYGKNGLNYYRKMTELEGAKI